MVENVLAGDFGIENLSIIDASRICKQTWHKVSEGTIMKCFQKAGFAETEGVDVGEILDETHLELAVDNWEEPTFDP